MQIRIDEIVIPDDLEPKSGAQVTSRSAANIPIPPVVTITPDGNQLLFGQRYLIDARRMGEQKIEFKLEYEPSEERVSELRIAEQFHSSLLDRLAIGEAFISHRSKYDVNLKSFSKATGIPQSTIVQHESLVKKLAPELKSYLSDGGLKFKEARALVGIPDHARQIELARPFMQGAMSSSQIEPVVGLAKRHPSSSISEVLALYEGRSESESPDMPDDGRSTDGNAAAEGESPNRANPTEPQSLVEELINLASRMQSEISGVERESDLSKKDSHFEPAETQSDQSTVETAQVTALVDIDDYLMGVRIDNLAQSEPKSLELIKVNQAFMSPSVILCDRSRFSKYLPSELMVEPGPNVLVLIESPTQDDYDAIFDLGIWGVVDTKKSNLELLKWILEASRSTDSQMKMALPAQTVYIGPQTATLTGGESTSTANAVSLSPRELKMLEYLASGFSSRRISEATDLSLQTVKNYIQILMEKLNVRTRAHAVAKGFRSGVLK
jgi:DNA-binding NarL/FixJ family response regulator